ncbi:MAG: methylenetetrahydrofolate reductase [NAD(P)H] [Gammaproteobacteria bacterium]|nr:methylenetetrahydrofolate reductase [NAD(P)H] [Gammaproteobacteria bacterium]NND38183.1 methylenetetrahydrofolate reductase [NAD(P)H] [Pseudomonadales bacterium]MBT8150691.1 methylenetetrahydrofolate reductase [NAD(P)H] [Gammaproteobacteria bacterium]NNL10373.1 methylenetetrahydrofolate reductase [NAD(P)H] [Pseudomonadales bacterium]NNM10908.1 methylenetetrahydrofolate reductase [NAD(P)H] [Pseudomonadales bacterium]
MPLQKKHRLSFEFFPPKTEKGASKLRATRNQLARLSPDFFSVTYGAGGSTRDNTRDVVLEGIRDGYAIAPHLSFGGDTQDSIRSLLDQYAAAKVERIVALRGDLPSGYGDGSRLVHASELVEFIRAHYGSAFHLEVAAYPEIHPEAESYDSDIGFLKQKFEVGADSAITQYFYNADAYARFMESCARAGINKPVYPGVMPITNFENLKRFSANCGAEIPRWLGYRIESYGDDLHARDQFCIEFISELCEKLLAMDAPGLHFYTMNQAASVEAICQRLGVNAS